MKITLTLKFLISPMKPAKDVQFPPYGELGGGGEVETLATFLLPSYTNVLAEIIICNLHANITHLRAYSIISNCLQENKTFSYPFKMPDLYGNMKHTV